MSDVDIKYGATAGTSGSGNGSISWSNINPDDSGNGYIDITFSGMTKDSSTKTFNLKATTSGLSGVSVSSDSLTGPQNLNGNNYMIMGIIYLKINADNFSGTITLSATS